MDPLDGFLGGNVKSIHGCHQGEQDEEELLGHHFGRVGET